MLDPAITPTQSRLRCTIFVNVIDCVVSGVVEQVYSSTLVLSVKNTRNVSPKRFIFTSKCTSMRLVVGVRPDSKKPRRSNNIRESAKYVKANK